jgi:hypothetical protein
MQQRLTGRYYHKKTLFGLVLMVEEAAVSLVLPGKHYPLSTRWRRATLKDAEALHLYEAKPVISPLS